MSDTDGCKVELWHWNWGRWQYAKCTASDRAYVTYKGRRIYLDEVQAVGTPWDGHAERRRLPGMELAGTMALTAFSGYEIWRSLDGGPERLRVCCVCW